VERKGRERERERVEHLSLLQGETMGALTGLLSALVALLWTLPPGQSVCLPCQLVWISSIGYLLSVWLVKMTSEINGNSSWHQTVFMLISVLSPGSLGEECSSFRHVENGRTFFRYSGLYVAFTCNPGYKIHGYRTNSCVSGQWTREPPVCVGK
jgi:hypothetical protein